MPEGQRESSGCLVATLLGCAGALVLGLILGAGVIGFLLFGVRGVAPVPRSGPSPVPSPVATESPVAPPSLDVDAAAEDEDLQITIEHKPYAIVGSTTSDLRRQMDLLGPTDAKGRHDAYTTWYVRWTHPYESSAAGCSLGDVKVSVRVTYTLPEWKPPPDASADVVTRWNRYLSALETHEDGHKNHGIGAGRDVLAELRRLGTRPTCAEAGRDANAEGNRVLDRYRKKDHGYDTSTNHGATQGARFP